MAESSPDEEAVYIGDIITMDAAAPAAEALVTHGAWITFVGGRDAALTRASPHATIVELTGEQALLPGFIDGHGHIGLVVLFERSVDLTPKPVGSISSIGDLQAALGAAISEGPPENSWLIGSNYDDALMDEHRHPTRDDLDAVTTECPVTVVHASGHLAVCNSAALATCGISASTPNPEGGVIRRRPESDEPNGVLEEHAWMELAAPFLPRPIPREGIADLGAAQQKYAAQGFTTVQEGFTDSAAMRLLATANEMGKLFVDVVAYPSWTEANQLLTGKTASTTYDGRMRIGGVKIVLDGSPQGKTAWLSSPYRTPPEGKGTDYAGYPAMDDATATESVTHFHKLGWPVFAHTNGDAACEQFIRAAAAARGDARGGDPREFVMIHAQMVREDQLDEMARLGIMPTFFVTHTYYWGDWHRDNVLGPERAARISPLASARRRKIRFSLHNDSPVAPIRSMVLIWSAVNRLTLSGKVLGPEQRVPVEAALQAVTIDAAYQYGEEGTKGSLRAGKLADLVILNRNPLKVDAMELRDIEIIRTVSHGIPIYERPQPLS